VPIQPFVVLLYDHDKIDDTEKKKTKGTHICYKASIPGTSKK